MIIIPRLCLARGLGSNKSTYYVPGISQEANCGQSELTPGHQGTWWERSIPQALSRRVLVPPPSDCGKRLHGFNEKGLKYRRRKWWLWSELTCKQWKSKGGGKSEGPVMNLNNLWKGLESLTRISLVTLSRMGIRAISQAGFRVRAFHVDQGNGDKRKEKAWPRHFTMLSWI